MLIVEDEALIALDLERRLLRLGFDVVGIADNRDEALALFEEHQPDIVLMDIFIRGPVDGIETARALHKVGDVPVVFLTAYADEDTVRRAAEISPYGYLLKPFDAGTLSATIRVALERHAADTRARLLGAAVESATIGIALVDARSEGRPMVFINDAYLRMAGRTRDEILGRRACFLAAHPEHPAVKGLHEAIDRGEQASAIVEGRSAGSSEAFWSSVSVSPVPDRSGRVTHLLVFHADITKQREAESALVESQRVELVGRLTASIAHDFNNVLNAIIAFADLAKFGLDDPQRASDIDEIAHAARRGAMLTRKLLDFSRREEASQAASALLDRVVEEARAVASRLAGPKVPVDMELGVGSTAVRLDATSIEQILLNLVANARDAMPSGGRVKVRTSLPADPSGKLEGGRYARLEVADTGTGIDEATLARIFEPLFTTKPRGAGTGLGLSTCATLVERAGGTIHVRSQLGTGSTFVVDLPIADAPARKPALTPSPTAVGSAGGARCLVVEGDAAVRSACVRALTQAGFVTTDVATGEAAIAAITELGSSLDLVVCDAIGGSLGASHVIARAKHVAPAVAALVMTGNADPASLGLGADVPVLWKPVAPATLVQRALEAVGVGTSPTKSS